MGKRKHFRKIMSLAKLSNVITQLKAKGKTIVLTTGVFDIFHPGHLYYLEKISAFGDILVVGLAADKIINKGSGRPIFNEQERQIVLAGLAAVDYPVIFTDIKEFISQIKPHIWVISPTSNPKHNQEKKDLAIRYNIKIIKLDSSYPLHTSDIIAKIKEIKEK
ncbi:MAG: hypothetical protein A2Y82_05145 [Candidatus Buchananbacteria bacterium RBG_13_36_9]|uniref:Cytidyltransferase-like domain-containing protein n=1 Tax=Candidatus Buchananbacteria bacterium RBG_13_36_9 TaxID=1797530 RepID=A0A1G1XPQ7_9BACT|nr:MAG: hypothetical protein A2Y82_05145 [Candidatus Buchananbacteria bacterium RBG_13_36_9]